MGKVLADEPAVDEHQKADQEHGHAQLIDEVHGPQVEVGMAIRIVLAKEVAEYRAKIKQVFAHGCEDFQYINITPPAPE